MDTHTLEHVIEEYFKEIRPAAKEGLTIDIEKINNTLYFDKSCYRKDIQKIIKKYMFNGNLEKTLDDITKLYKSDEELLFGKFFKSLNQ